MAEQVEESEFGGFFYTFDYIAQLDDKIAKEKETLKSLNKQRKDGMAQMMRQGIQIVQTVRMNGSMTGQVKLDDFMGSKHKVHASDEDNNEDDE